MLVRFREIGISIDAGDPRIGRLIDAVKEREHDGYSYDGAEASFELFARRAIESVPEFFRLSSFRVIDERRWDAKGQLITMSEATIKIIVGDEHAMTVAEGNGPVNALDNALRKALLPHYPALESMRLVDYKVRILTPDAGTRAVTRVMIESTDGTGARWATVGVSANVIDASYVALNDSITYMLYHDRAGRPRR